MSSLGPPVDKRLLAQVPALKPLIVILGGLGLMRAISWIVIAFSISHIVVAARDQSDVGNGTFIALILALLVRPVASYIAEVLARNVAAKVKHDLRMRAIEALGNKDANAPSTGQYLATLTTGADALDDWFAKFLPTFVEAAIMPVLMIGTILISDWISFIVLCVTVPLLGVFGWLIGVETQAQADRQYSAMTRLSGHFLDLLKGLETLRLFGVAKAQRETVFHIADELRRETMTTLRIAFMSALALELIAMIGTALIAVTIGIRLSFSMMDLEVGLAVLIMAPEAYLPIRRVGATFHSSTEGASAGRELLDIIEGKKSGVIDSGTGVVNPQNWSLERVVVKRDDRVNLSEVSMGIERGEIIALTGESGSGKSTLLKVLAGLIKPSKGSIYVNGNKVEDNASNYGVAWLSQRPVVLSSTLRENLTLGNDIEEEKIIDALEKAGASELSVLLDKPVGDGGIILSGGQIRRMGLARAILSEPVLLLADEPTAEVDFVGASIIRRELAMLAKSGVAVLVATHDKELMDIADRRVHLEIGGKSYL